MSRIIIFLLLLLGLGAVAVPNPVPDVYGTVELQERHGGLQNLVKRYLNAAKGGKYLFLDMSVPRLTLSVLLAPRQAMTVPGTAHMMYNWFDVPVAQMWLFKEFGCSLQPEVKENPYCKLTATVRSMSCFLINL